jgi:hypothetical protein
VPRRGDEDLDAELRAHLELAADDGRRAGRAAADPRAPRLRAGGLSQAMEAVRDARGLPWLEALVSDAVFAARQLRRHRIASAAIVCSVGLAAGATTAAFRLIDAVLLRPLPVAEPHRLFALGWHRRTPQGRTEYRDDFDYPTFRRYAAALAGHGDALLIGMSARLEVRLAAGLGLAAIAGTVLDRFLFGLSPADPVSHLAVLLLLGGIGLLATALPVRRALHVDPAVTLRSE